MVSMENPGPYGLAGMATHSSLVWQHGEFLVDVPYFPFFLKCKQFLEGFVVVSFFFYSKSFFLVRSKSISCWNDWRGEGGCERWRTKSYSPANHKTQTTVKEIIAIIPSFPSCFFPCVFCYLVFGHPACFFNQWELLPLRIEQCTTVSLSCDFIKYWTFQEVNNLLVKFKL